MDCKCISLSALAYTDTKDNITNINQENNLSSACPKVSSNRQEVYSNRKMVDLIYKYFKQLPPRLICLNYNQDGSMDPHWNDHFKHLPHTCLQVVHQCHRPKLLLHQTKCTYQLEFQLQTNQLIWLLLLTLTNQQEVLSLGVLQLPFLPISLSPLTQVTPTVTK